MPSPPARRLIIDLHGHGIVSVPMFGRYNYRRAGKGLDDHRHARALEICFLERGRQTYTVKGQDFLLQGGDVFLTYPGETHGTGGAPEEKGLLYWMTVSDPVTTGGSLLGLSPRHGKALWTQLMKSRRRHFPGTPEIKLHLDHAIRLAMKPKSSLGTVTIANHLVSFLLRVIASRENATGSSPGHSLEPLLRYMEGMLEEPDQLTVAKLATMAGLSESRFKSLFKQRMGIPPAEYVLRKRIDEASHRLRKAGASVTEVAYSLGFSSSQYFASVFKRFTNAHPSSLLVRKLGRTRHHR